MLLEESGWEWRRLPLKSAERSTLVYRLGDPKVWYSQSSNLVKPYMICLLRAEDIITGAVTEIPHYSNKPTRDYGRLLEGKPLLKGLKSLECDVGVQGGLQLAVRAPIDDIPGSDDHDFDLDAALEEHFDEMMLGLSSEEYLALYGESAPPMPPPSTPPGNASPVASPFASSVASPVVQAESVDEFNVVAWNQSLMDVCRTTSWGPFAFTYKSAGPGLMYGSLQATCLYHKKSESTGCKKTVKLRVGTHEHIDEVMWALKH